MSSSLSKTLTLTKKITRRLFKPLERLNMWRWAEKYVSLPASFSKVHGNYDSGYTPAWRPVFETITEPHVRMLVLKKGVQVGGTLFNQIVLFFYAVTKGIPMIYVGQTERDVKDFLTDRLHPMMKLCKPIMEIVPPARKWTQEKMLFNGIPCYFAHGSSVNALASKSCGIGLFDEINKWIHKSKGKEAKALLLALARLTSFEPDEKAILTSTPTVPSGDIDEYYDMSDQREHHFKCPHCDHEQPWVFSEDRIQFAQCKKDNGKWDYERVAKETTYGCVNCGESITEDYRMKLVREGRFIPMNPEAPKHIVGYLYNQFLAPQITWGMMAVKFLEAKSTPDGLHGFYNNILGLAFDVAAFQNTHKTVEALLEFSPEYKRGELPFIPKYFLTTVDVQKRSFWWMKTCWDEFGNVAIIDWGEAVSWREIETLRNQKHACLGSDMQFIANMGIVDSGYDAKEVYDYCWATGGKMNPSKGGDRKMASGLVEAKKMMHKRRTMWLYNYYDTSMKNWVLAQRLRGHGATPQDDPDGRIYLPRDYNNDGGILSEQLIDERRVQKFEKGKKINVYTTKDPNRANNHLADCLKESHVAYHYANPVWNKEAENDTEDKSE